MREITKQLGPQIRDAIELHGHLGPFLVIGFRMGKAAKQILDPEGLKKTELQASVDVPLQTPFSCILDGIQSSTHCTIGNQRLTVKQSRQKISSRFDATGSDKILTIIVNPEIIKEIRDKISRGITNESLAETIASMPEQRLFQINVSQKHR